MTVHFANPWWLLLLLILIPMVSFELRRKAGVTVPTIRRWKIVKKRRWAFMKHLIFIVRASALISLILAMARPQIGRSYSSRKTEGLDIMLVIDTSNSMKALDFISDGKRVDRLVVVKNVLHEFINGRPDDRLGLVVFGTNAFAQAPLTLDHDVLLRYIDSAQIGMAGESTAIGDAIGVAVNRLKDITAKSKLIILLTDGSNTAGKIDPRQAADAAKALDVKLYAIGIGSNGPVPIQTEFGIRNVILELDEKLLKAIAEKTGGKYFRASDTETLKEIYKTIDALEKSELEVKVYHNFEEQFGWLVGIGLSLFLLELVLRTTRFRRVP